MVTKAKLTIIGPGKLGRSLANCLSQAELVSINQVFSRDLARATEAVAVIGAGEAVSDWADLRPSDYWLLSVADHALAATAEQLATLQLVDANTVVFHVSGIITSDCLAPLAKLGAKVASLHPVRSFSGEALAPSAFANTFCVLEGDESAKQGLEALFAQLDARLIDLKASDKPLYHAALVLMANYTVTLAAEASKLLQSIGIDGLAAKQLLAPLLESVAINIKHLPIADALTGPLQRGEIATIKQHLQSLPDGQVKALYCLLGELTIKDLLQLDAGLRDELLGVFDIYS